MAEVRERPYGQFNYVVMIDGKKLPDAAFQEVSGLGPKVADITLKRGVFGELGLLQAWMKNVRKTVVIQLLREDRTGPVQSWTLRAARPIKYTGPALSAKGSDVVIEELVLSCEGIELE